MSRDCRRASVGRGLGAVLLLWLVPSLLPAADLPKARSLLLRGRYEEAAEIYHSHSPRSPEVALGLAAALEAQGKAAEAVEILKPLAEKDAEVEATLASLAFARGDHEEAGRRVQAALRLAAAHPLALYLQAELARTAGRLEAAERDYRRLIDFYNSRAVKKPESLRWIGRAGAQYARWKRLSSQFDLLVNELFPAALKLDPDFWPAHYEAGLLFMEKFNRADAMKEFQAALAINPRAAEVHAAVACQALEDFHLEQAEASLRRAEEINPRLPEVWQLKADIAWFNGRTEDALRLLREKLLPLDPVEEATLGRIAACYFVQSPRLAAQGQATAARPGERPAEQDEYGRRFAALEAEVIRRNPHAGMFYAELARMLQIRNRREAAERYCREAIRVLPRQPEPHARLGLMLMQMGREDDARRLLKEAFEADPFHIRVKNSLDVLDVLDGMQTHRTTHFTIRYDQDDSRLVPYLARRLEAVHEQFRRQFGYAPPQPTLVEIFRETHGQSGHAWFSARTVGLPYLGTVAASTGPVVAMVSPGETRGHGGFGWSRVVGHEMAHVFHLQQTGYNIPHWCTEGLAVHQEGIARPYHWTLLLRRRRAEGTLLDLDTVNAAFARRMDSDDCQLAYCQSELYVEYMIARAGEGSLRKLVEAYARDPSTSAAIREVFGLSVPDFERGYRDFVYRQIDAVPVLDAEQTVRFRESAGAKMKARQFGEAADLFARAEQLDPANPRWPAGRASACLAAGRKEDLARALTRFAELVPDDLPSRKKLAELALERRDAAAARRWAAAAMEIQIEDAETHRLLAEALVLLNGLGEAIAEFRAAVELAPDHSPARFALADALLQAGQTAEARKTLQELLRRDPKYPGAAALLERLEKEP